MDILKEIADCSVPYHQADFLSETLGPHAEAVKQGKLPFILFGAGSAGRRLLPLFERHGTPPIMFCDNDAGKIGGLIHGTPVLSIESAHARQPAAVVVLAMAQGQEKVRAQLMASGFLKERIVHVRQPALQFYTHIDQWHWSQLDLSSNAHELAHAYALLSDEASQRLFLQRIGLLAGGSDFKAYMAHIKEHSFIEKYPPDNMHQGPENFYYFNNDVVRLSARETLVDCGAFDGDSLEQFLRAGQRFPEGNYQAHCLEPDPQNFAKLANSYGENTNIRLYQSGAWSEKASLNFESSTSVTVSTPSSAKVSENGTGLLVEADALDRLLAGEDVSFIKMDIEGAEIQALEGSSEIIARCKPTLAISVYHRRDDIFQIPLLVDRLCPGYRFHLRLFSQNFTELVLLAIHEQNSMIETCS